MTTFYVATAANGGNDSNPGSQAQPWLTVNKATTTVTTFGDLIHVGLGTFSETAQLSLSVGVSLEGEGPGTIIKTGYTSDTNPIHAFVALVSSSEGTNGQQEIRNLKLDGNALSFHFGIYVRARKNVSIHDCTFVDFNDWGIHFNGQAVDANGEATIYATDNQFYNNIVTNCALYSGFGRGELQIDSQERMLIYGNTFDQTGRAAGSNGYCIKAGFYLGFFKGVKIYNNTMTKAAYDGSTFDFAVEFFNIKGGCEFYNNTILSGSWDTNTSVKGSYTFTMDVHHNTFGPTTQKTTGPSFGFIMEDGCSDTFIHHNTFRNVQFGIHTNVNSGPRTFSNILIHHNVFDSMSLTGQNGSAQGWNSSETLPVSTFSGWGVFNNVSYGRSAFHLDGYRTDGVGIMSNFTYRNNICVNASRSPVHTFLQVTGSTLDKIDIEYNSFSSCGNNNSYQTQGMSPTNVTNANNQTSDPQFSDATAGLFTLRATSPCRDAGAIVPSITDGYVGLAPDIGAFEFAPQALNTIYLYTPQARGPIGMTSHFTASLGTVTVGPSGTAEAQVAVPARLMTPNAPSWATGDCLIANPLSSNLSVGLIWGSYVSSTRTAVVRLANASASTATVAASVIWSFMGFARIP